MTEPVDIQLQDGIAPSIVPTLREIAETARLGYSTLTTLQDALNEIDAGAMSQLSKATQGASTSLKDAADKQTTLTGATNNASVAATTFTGEIKKAEIATAAASASSNVYASALGGLKSALSFLGVGLGVKYFIDQSDGYSKMIDKLKDVSKSYDDLAAKETRLFGIAQQTRQAFESTTSVYVSLAKATKDTTVTETELFRTTELLDKALTASGKSSESVTGALRGFAAGLTSGRTAAFAMRSLLLEFPLLGKAVAQGLGLASQEFVKKAQEGEITIQQFITGLNNASSIIDAKFARTTITVSSAFTVFQNAAFRFIGQANEAAGVTSVLSNAIIFAANHFDVLAGIVGIVAVRFAAMLAINTAQFFIQLATSAVAAGVALIGFATPVGILVAAVTAGAIAVAYFTGSLDGLIEKTKSVGDAIGESINARIQESIGEFGKATDAAGKFSDGINKLNSNIRLTEAELDAMMNKSHSAFLRMQEDAAREAIELSQVKTKVDELGRSLTETGSAGSSAFSSIASSASSAASSIERAASASASVASHLGNAGFGSGRNSGTVSNFDEWDNFHPTLSFTRPRNQIEIEDEVLKIVGVSNLKRLQAGASAKQILNDQQLTALELIRREQSRYGSGPSYQAYSGGGGGASFQIGRFPFQFAEGGEFTVGGSGPKDSQLIRMWASPDETVTVETPAQRAKRLRESDGGGRIQIGTVKIEIATKDADSFRRNKDQIGTQVIGQLRRVAARSGLT